MIQIMSISIAAATLTRAIEEETYSSATASDGNDSLQITDGELPGLMNQWADDAWSTLIAAAGEYHAGNSNISGARQMSLAMPGNFDGAQKDALQSQMTAYMLARMLTRWYESTAPDRASIHAAEAASAITTIEQILHSRKRPKR